MIFMLESCRSLSWWGRCRLHQRMRCRFLDPWLCHLSCYAATWEACEEDQEHFLRLQPTIGELSLLSPWHHSDVRYPNLPLVTRYSWLICKKKCCLSGGLNPPHQKNIKKPCDAVGFWPWDKRLADLCWSSIRFKLSDLLRADVALSQKIGGIESILFRSLAFFSPKFFIIFPIPGAIIFQSPELAGLGGLWKPVRGLGAWSSVAAQFKFMGEMGEMGEMDGRLGYIMLHPFYLHNVNIYIYT